MSTKYCSYGRSPNLAVCLILYMFSWAYWSTLTSTLSGNSRTCCLAFEGRDHNDILSKFKAKIAWFNLNLMMSRKVMRKGIVILLCINTFTPFDEPYVGGTRFKGYRQ